MEQQDKANELSELRTRVERLEEELADDKMQWPPQSYYTAYHVLAGFVLGMFGAATSLLFNIVGSLIVGQYPLRLIQVYLTFPMGEAALSMDSGLALAIGCCLYMGTGMCYGIVFHLVLSRWFEKSDIRRRLVVVSLLGIALWLVNFYGILVWLQPALFGGNWIVDQIPWWVAMFTHLVFAWTMVLVQPLGTFIPRPNPTDKT